MLFICIVASWGTLGFEGILCVCAGVVSSLIATLAMCVIAAIAVVVWMTWVVTSYAVMSHY